MWGIGLFLFDHSRWDQLYNNCSQIDTTPLPWANRRFVPESIILIVLCTIYYALYFPCMYSFWRNLRDEKGKPNACYQLMFYIGIVDMGSLWIVGFAHGISFLYGMVYCAHPQMYFLFGLFAMTFTDAEAFADTVLALNRCVEILSPHLAEKMFGGKRIWLWLCPATLYGLKATFFYRPLIYNGVIFAKTLNPYFGFWDDGGKTFPTVYLMSVQELLLCFGTPTIYALFLVGLWIRIKAFKGEQNQQQISKVQWAAFTQVFIISLFNVLAGGMYFSMQYFPSFVAPKTMILGHFAWVHINGIPPVIYIIFNKTVRSDIRLLYLKIFQSQRIHHVNGVTLISPSNNNKINQTNVGNLSIEGKSNNA